MHLQAGDMFVDSRRVGDATISVISDATFLYNLHIEAPDAELRDALPDADAAGNVLLGYHAMHIQIGNASILVDAGFADPGSTSTSTMAAGLLAFARTPGVKAGLASINVQPEQITHVLITHTHHDHFLGVTVEREGRHVPAYPNARHLVQRRDWEGNPEREDPHSELTGRLGTIERHGLLDLVDGNREVVPGVTMIHAPGESPGHAIVRVQSAGETFYALGDLFHHMCEIEHPDWSPPWPDKAALLASRKALLAEAVAHNATAVFTHALFPPWGRVVPAGSGYSWEWTARTPRA